MKFTCNEPLAQDIYKLQGKCAQEIYNLQGKCTLCRNISEATLALRNMQMLQVLVDVSDGKNDLGFFLIFYKGLVVRAVGWGVFTWVQNPCIWCLMYQ